LSFSQPCDLSLKINKSTPYHCQKMNDRCEGFYQAPVSSVTRIDLIGATKGKFFYNMDSTEVVRISSPLTGGKTIRVRAQAIPVKTYYRMDAVIHPGETVQWHMKDVLLPNNLTPDKIRILGWYESNDQKVYVPVKTEAKKSSVQNNDIIYITFRPTVKIKNIQYLVYDYQTKESTDWKQPTFNTCRAGMPFNVMLNQNKGLYRITVSGLIAGSEDEWIEQQIDINTGE
jgi:hypothetical protein